MEEKAAVWLQVPNAAWAQWEDHNLFTFYIFFVSKKLLCAEALLGFFLLLFVLLVASSWQWKLLSTDSRVRPGRASSEVGTLQPSERWKTSPGGERHYKALMEDGLSSCSCPHVLTDVGARCSFIAMPREAQPRAWIYSARGQGAKFTSDITKKCTGDFFLCKNLLYHAAVSHHRGFNLRFSEILRVSILHRIWNVIYFLLPLTIKLHSVALHVMLSNLIPNIL